MTHRSTVRAQRERPALTRTEVVDAALTLIDADGVEALTMRKVAAALDAGTMTLYWHVGNRDELLSHVVDSVLVQVEHAPEGADWRTQASVFCRSYVTVLRRHPKLVPVVAAARLGPVALKTLEYLVSVFRATGLDDEMAVQAAKAAAAVTWGFLLPPSHARNPMTVDGTTLGELPADDYPHLTRAAPLADAELDFTWFELALDSVLDRVSQQIAAP